VAKTLEVTVPDLGDFHDVAVIEIAVKPGDAVEKDQPLLTLETDKATMELPSPGAGVVKEFFVTVGTKVSKGARIASLEIAEGGGSVLPAAAPAKPAPLPRQWQSLPLSLSNPPWSRQGPIWQPVCASPPLTRRLRPRTCPASRRHHCSPA
jgi:pyruvate/2-oxoglutarate dehydrogenase complex dihydrolipoamide acyltransferase (E2) component